MNRSITLGGSIHFHNRSASYQTPINPITPHPTTPTRSCPHTYLDHLGAHRARGPNHPHLLHPHAATARHACLLGLLAAVWLDLPVFVFFGVRVVDCWMRWGDEGCIRCSSGPTGHTPLIGSPQVDSPHNHASHENWRILRRILSNRKRKGRAARTHRFTTRCFVMTCTCCLVSVARLHTTRLSRAGGI